MTGCSHSDAIVRAKNGADGMSIDTLLEELNACSGVTGSFVFDSEGGIHARALPDRFDTAQLQQAGKAVSQTLAALERARRRKAGDIDLVFVRERLVIKPLADAFLAILCAPRINIALLNLTAQRVARDLRQELEQPGAQPPDPAASKLDKLKEAVTVGLGDHAFKALEILSAADPSPADLARAAEEIEAMTRLFIDRKKAVEIGKRLRAILEA